MVMQTVIAILIGYLFGCIQAAFILSKLVGKMDIREHGSGNAGASNITTIMGVKYGFIVGLVDVLKGLFAVLVIKWIYPGSPDLAYLSGIMAILGHIFPIYLKFKGGKGVSTSFGVALGLWPYFTVCASFFAVTWVVVALTWRYVSLASICGSITFPVTLAIAIAMKRNWDLANLWPLLVAATAIPILVIVLHRGNIKRLIAGTESKVHSRKDRS